MSNNIYDILKKFNSLDSVKNMLSEGKKVCSDCGKAKCECVNESKGSKPDFLDMDKDGDTNEPMKKAAKDKSKGAIAEAVARVEQNLAEKYQGFKKMSEGVRPIGTINPTDQGDEYTPQPGYRVKAEFEPGSTGKPKMGFVKSDPEQKGQGAKPEQTGPGPKDSFDSDKFGRPVREGDMDESALQAYLGKKKYGREGMQALQQAGRDGASKEKMAKIRARHDKMDEDNSGTVPPKHYGGKGPTGAAFDLYMQQRKEQLATQRPKNEDMLSPGQKKIARMSPPPNKIDANDLAALRAGKKKKVEGNAFSGAVAKAKATGQDEFKVGGKEYEVQEGIEDTLQNILPKSMQPFNTETAAKNAAAARASKAQAPVKEGFPTVDDAKKRMDAKAGKTAHGTKTVTKTGVKHERDYDADEPTGERGRPKKDKFAK